MKIIKRILLAILLNAGIVSCAYLASEYNPEPDKSDTYDYVCYRIELDFAEASCDDLDAPTVIVTKLLTSFDTRWSQILGMFVLGENNIFIRAGLNAEEHTEILIHETTHYVLYWLGLVDDDDTCEHERLARLYSDGPWDQGTRNLYGCPADKET